MSDNRANSPTRLDKCLALQALHQSPSAWIIPNPWDIGSAKLLEAQGFRALATTSSGFAYTLGRADGEVSLEEKLEHCRQLSATTNIPISADFENGFADNPEQVMANIRRLAATGIAGCSIEDFSRDTHTLYDFNFAVERVQAAAEALAELEVPIQLTARTEQLLRGDYALDEAISRLQAFEAAGAQVLYAPAVRSLEDLKSITDATQLPFNVLASFIPAATLEDFTAAGATRISLGGSLNYAAISPLLKASQEMLEKGSFGWLRDTANGAQVRDLLNKV